MGEEPVSFLEKSVCYKNIFYFRSGLNSLYLYLYATYFTEYNAMEIDIKVHLKYS